ncbi:MAG: site-specific integrase [Oscillospiraceae bacterium]|nr:site-specific integrase [Oscillospiraceae bacterium]
MARRGLNIYRRKDGRWEGRYKNGFRADGKVRYSSVYGKSYSAVRIILDEKRAESQKSVSRRSSCTVGELVDSWLFDLKNRVKESTYSNYCMKLRKHILPHFAQQKYSTLTADDLNAFTAEKIRSGLSEKYVADIIVLLKSVAKFGRKRYGYANMIEYAAIPRASKISEKKLLTRSEQSVLKAELLKAPDSSNIGIMLSAATGIRIGELCALKWSDFDFEKSVMTVKRTVQRISRAGEKGTHIIVSSPKSAASAREIPLPEFLLPFLNANRSKDSDLILSGSEKIIEPRTMQYRFKSILKKAGLPSVNFHALRHMFATNCIELGFDVKTLSEILGHSSVQVTLNRYVHSSIERKRYCMKLFEDNFLSL